MAKTGFSPAGSDSENDLAVVRRILAGEQTAFACLMRRFNRQLYRLARSVMRDDAEAEDALQDAYLSAYRSLSNFRGESSLGTWLSRLLINECLGRLRRRERRQNVIPMTPYPLDDVLDRVASDDCASPDELTARAQMRKLLESTIDALPVGLRAVFVLRSVEELTVAETAQCLGIPAETVRSRHFRAKSLLREALEHRVSLAERDVFEFAGARCDQIVARVLARLTVVPQMHGGEVA